MVKNRLSSLLVEAVAVLICLLFVIPFVFAVINSFKTYPEMMESFIRLPNRLNFENYVKAWTVMKGLRPFINSIIITVFSIIGIVLFSSMAAYKLSRTKDRKSWVIYLIFVFALVVPFHCYMIPLVKLTASLKLTKSYIGIVLIYWGICMPYAIFLQHGFVKSIPYDIEESAVIDGCTPFKTFFFIVFPLMKPIVSTLIVIDVIMIWNDFLLPMLIIFMDSILRTVPFVQYNLYGEYNNEWNTALAAMVLAVVPCVIFFIFMQKYIVRGITSGSVKG